jgi:hypothetical protein
MRTSTKQLDILKLRSLGYSEREIEFITTTGWILCFLHGHGRTPYREYIQNWLDGKIDVLIYTDEESFITINCVDESHEIHFFN